MNDWISVNDKLPDNFYRDWPDNGSTEVLATNGYSTVIATYNWRDLGFYHNDYDANGLGIKEITHWMPLPELPNRYPFNSAAHGIKEETK